MKTLSAVAALLALTLPAALPGTTLAQTVALPQGAVEGVTQYDVESFKGIPYAAPPVGDLRWRAPQAAPGWTGVRVADHFAPDCLQHPLRGDDAPLGVKPSEDCLYLNVWRPADTKSGEKLPVMVWVYGGGYVSGGTSPAIYNGKAFARDGIVFVSFNYRVGRFGFFGFPELTKEDADHGQLGDYAYMDMIAALKWVKANIAAFGGDPDQVTIFGESAGGAAMHTLLTSPQSKGLFNRAIIESGGGRGNLMGPRLLHDDRPGRPSGENIGVAFAKAHGIDGTGPAALKALRALPADAIVSGLGLADYQPDTYAGPMLDGHIVVEDPDKAYAAGRDVGASVMVGATSGDLMPKFAADKDALFASFGAEADAARKAYDPDGSAPLPLLNAEVGMDQVMEEPARLTAQALSAHGRTVYEYRFDYTASQKKAGSPFGAPHASELPFVFETVEARYGEAATAEDHAAARLMHAYWANFAKTGDPNGAGLPQWPVYDATKDELLILTPDAGAKAVADPWKARLDVTAKAADAASK
ncbi:MAG: carboxylesterase/lipase family protein [Asticcacaulis sp.]|uniref:carboxylesterase/lipase family protein n=1 Tax=Asticcacaulis sp. TaxID=1872648 RepID=UPI003F7BB125